MCTRMIVTAHPPKMIVQYCIYSNYFFQKYQYVVMDQHKLTFCIIEVGEMGNILCATKPNLSF